MDEAWRVLLSSGWNEHLVVRWWMLRADSLRYAGRVILEYGIPVEMRLRIGEDVREGVVKMLIAHEVAHVIAPDDDCHGECWLSALRHVVRSAYDLEGEIVDWMSASPPPFFVNAALCALLERT